MPVLRRRFSGPPACRVVSPAALRLPTFHRISTELSQTNSSANQLSTMQPRHRLHYSTIPNDRNVSCLQGDVSEQAGSDILPTIPPFHSANNAKVLPCHNAVSSNYSAMPPFRQCHHSTVSSFYSIVILVSSFYSIFVLFHHRAGLPIVSNNHHSNNETVQTRKSFQRIIIPEYDPKVCCIKVCVGALPTL